MAEFPTEIIRSEPVREPVPEFEGSWERSNRNPVSAAIFGVIIIGLVYYYAQGILAAIVFFITKPVGNQKLVGQTFVEVMTYTMNSMKAPIRVALLLSQLFFMLVPTIWIVRHWHTKKFLTYVRFKTVPVLEVVLAIAATICFVPVSGFIGEFFLRQLNFPDFLARINEELFTSYNPPEFIWVVIVVCLTPAICEETLFRGYVQRTLERRLGLKSIFITGIVFGLYHMEPISLVSLSLIGIMIGFFFYRSGSLLPGMAAHFTNNFIGILSSYRNHAGEPRLQFLSADVGWIGILIFLLLTVGIIYLYDSYAKKSSRARPT